MSFPVIRFFLMFVVGLIGLRISKKNFKVFIVFAILIFLSSFIPFEQPFLKFDTLSEAIKYRIPNIHILRKWEKEDYAFIIFREDIATAGYKYFLKTDGKWQLMPEIYCDLKYFQHGDYTIIYYEIPNREVFIYVRYLKNKGGKAHSKISVSDSLNSNFDEDIFKLDKKYKYNFMYNYYTFIPELNEDYYIKINNEKIYFKGD